MLHSECTLHSFFFEAIFWHHRVAHTLWRPYHQPFDGKLRLENSMHLLESPLDTHMSPSFAPSPAYGERNSLRSGRPLSSIVCLLARAPASDAYQFIFATSDQTMRTNNYTIFQLRRCSACFARVPCLRRPACFVYVWCLLPLPRLARPVAGPRPMTTANICYLIHMLTHLSPRSPRLSSRHFAFALSVMPVTRTLP